MQGCWERAGDEERTTSESSVFLVSWRVIVIMIMICIWNGSY
jgi:hypothetical protein